MKKFFVLYFTLLALSASAAIYINGLPTYPVYSTFTVVVGGTNTIVTTNIVGNTITYSVNTLGWSTSALYSVRSDVVGLGFDTSSGPVGVLTGVVASSGGGASLPYSELRWGRRWEGSVDGGFIYTMAAGADDISADTTTNLDLYQCFFLCAATTAKTNTMYGHLFPPATGSYITIKFRANQPLGTAIFTATDGQTAVTTTQVIAAANTTYYTNMLLTGTCVTNWKLTVIQYTTNAGNQYRMGVGQ